MTRTIYAVLLAVLGLVAAGCGGGPEVAPRPPEQPSASESPVSSTRLGPAKVTEVAEKCAIIEEDLVRELGVSQPPRERDVNRMPGCEYRGSSAGEREWSAFVALNGDVSYKAELNRRPEPTGLADLQGYPGKTFRNGTECTLIADISDRGFLMVNGSVAGPDDRRPDACVIAEQVGGLTVRYLPDEPVAG